jgi:hypothetical protein
MTSLGSTDFTPVASGASLIRAWHVYDAEHFNVRDYL